MFEKFQQLKEASVRVANRGADAIKTMSEEVKAKAIANNVTINTERVVYQQAATVTAVQTASVLTRTASPSIKAQLTDEFQNLCQYLDQLKSPTREQEELSRSETQVVRSSLKRLIFALSMDDERYLAASYRANERTNPKDVSAGAG